MGCCVDFTQLCMLVCRYVVPTITAVNRAWISVITYRCNRNIKLCWKTCYHRGPWHLLFREWVSQTDLWLTLLKGNKNDSSKKYIPPDKLKTLSFSPQCMQCAHTCLTCWHVHTCSLWLQVMRTQWSGMHTLQGHVSFWLTFNCCLVESVLYVAAAESLCTGLCNSMYTHLCSAWHSNKD